MVLSNSVQRIQDLPADIQDLPEYHSLIIEARKIHNSSKIQYYPSGLRESIWMLAWNSYPAIKVQMILQFWEELYNLDSNTRSMEFLRFRKHVESILDLRK